MSKNWGALQTAKALRDLDPRIFIVIATAYSDIKPKEIHQYLGHGVLFINKPFKREEIEQSARNRSDPSSLG